MTITACAGWAPVDAEKAELHLRVGTSMLQNGNYPQALSELLKAEELDNTNPVVQNNLGLVYFARNRLDLAAQHIRRALQLKSDYTDAKNNLGRVLIEQEKYPEAQQILTEALKDLTFPNPEKPYLNLGLASFRQRQFKEAKNHLLHALEYQRNNCMAQTLYGRSLLELKEYANAASALDRAIGFCRNEEADEPQYYSALAYYQLGEQRKAETRLDEIIKIYPNGRYRDRARSMLETMRK
jgi:Tfp pilus assembly protein PilF